MIGANPYSSWPLKVTLFHPLAITAWEAASKNALPLPLGFTKTIELQGVDGKQGRGKGAPIDVSDGASLLSLATRP